MPYVPPIPTDKEVKCRYCHIRAWYSICSKDNYSYDISVCADHLHQGINWFIEIGPVIVSGYDYTTAEKAELAARKPSHLM